MAVNTSRLLASRKVSDAGIFTPAGRSRPGGGRSRARSISVCSSVLPSRADGDLGAQLVARRPQLFVDVGASSGSARPRPRTRPAPRSSLPIAAMRRRLRGSGPATRGSWRVRGPRGHQRSSGFWRTGFGVLDDRQVVVLAAFGVDGRCAARSTSRSSGAADTDRPRWRRAAGKRFRERLAVLTTSTPRGILNAKSLSAKPTFSFRFTKEKLDLPPCASIVTRPRIARVPGRRRA